MPEPIQDHASLIPYLMNELDPTERRDFETHMSGCASCSSEAGSLSHVAGMLETMAPAVAPPDLKAGVLAAVARAADQSSAAGASSPHLNGAARARPEAVGRRDQAAGRRKRSGFFGGWFAPASFAGALAAAVVAIVIVTGSDGAGTSAPVEIEGTLSGSSGGEVVVSLLGSGREVDLTSSNFPILPKGEAYEVWFVGAGDTKGDPNRISAGTFHPDEEGNTDVTLHAAVDPALYPLVEVTAEPTGGDPAVEGDVVASLDGSSQLP